LLDMKTVLAGRLGALALVSSLALAGSALAAGTTQTHHCVGKDGTPQPSLTHKQCTAAGGAWKKDAAPATAAPASKPAPESKPAKQPEPAPKAPAETPPAK